MCSDKQCTPRPASWLSSPVRLDDSATSSERVGHKFARLAASRARAAVPDAYCLPTEWLAQALGETRRQQLNKLVAGLAATLGNDAAALPAALDRILEGLALDEQMRHELAATVIALTQDRPAGRVAVRSSATSEDGADHSHAGLYDSFLNLHPVDVEGAVVACWRSYYSARAVLGRIRAGHQHAAPELAVIIQQMADARRAGVAFTQGDHTVIDSVAGTGDALVAGLVDAQRTHIGPGAQIGSASEAPALFGSVAELAQTLRNDSHGDVDIEWAWTGEDLVLLQVRPVTAGLRLPISADPEFNHARLYLDDALPPDLVLGDCADIYVSYITKRAPLYRLAAAHDIATGRGWVMAFNGAGLADPTQHPDWWRTLGEQVVLDLGPALRQHILPTHGLVEFLTQALNLDGDRLRIHTVILRDFLQGTTGIVTRQLDDGSTLVEHASQGLLAINRGLTEPDRLFLPALNDSLAWQRVARPTGWCSTALYDLARFTSVLDLRTPGTHAEWVVHDGRPVFIDHSAPTVQSDAVTSTDQATRSGRNTLIYAGSVQAPILLLRDSEELTRLSVAPIISVGFRADAPESSYITELLARIDSLPEKPIIHARRPYAILSLLLDRAAGFIFTGGSTLCHLAILLREAAIPSLIAPEVGIDLDSDNHQVIINNDAVFLG